MVVDGFDLSGNKLVDISLSSLYHIKVLKLQNNYLTQLSFLNCFPLLNILDLRNNCIQLFDGLKNLLFLELLFVDIEWNNIKITSNVST